MFVKYDNVQRYLYFNVCSYYHKEYQTYALIVTGGEIILSILAQYLWGAIITGFLTIYRVLNLDFWGFPINHTHTHTHTLATGGPVS